ncbi:MAG: molecular chaperone HtpG [Burkholderiales bacterium]|nr:molecular chaperone HtpG [Burkholderiales bacterium]
MAETSTKETLGFQTEVSQLLKLMVHSLYGNKQIFLRELISNGSDACDKLRFEALTDPALFESDPDLMLRIAIDRDARTITLSDNGIGMSRQEVVDNIGTIAKSGTREFLDRLTGDKAADAQLIGQFGVGFYSSFIVSDKVTLITRRAGLGAEHGVKWESPGEGSYTIETVTKKDRGTEVILHLREGEDDLLEGMRLRSIVHRYSDHINLPILMKKEEWNTDQSKMVVKDEDEQINQASALWARAKSEITDEQYQEFYKHVAHDFEPPMAWTHSKVEGRSEYTQLLYLPGRAPFDLWDREHRHGIKLYVRRVFIMDDAEQLLPAYLRFVRGVVDSNDLPLNVSREILQESKDVETIRKGCVNRVLGLVEDIAKNQEEKFAAFWKEFGRVLKEGVGEDFANKERIARLLRFSSTHEDSEDQSVSFEQYVGRMKDGQDKIYYVTADTHAAAKSSPHLEIFRAKGLEVLLLSDRVDEWVVSNLTEFDGKQLVSVAKGALDLGELGDEEKQAQEKEANEHKPLTERMKKALGEKVKEVRVTLRLTDSPACLVADANAMSMNLERMLKAAGQKVPSSNPILEINPRHPIVRRLEGEVNDERFADWSSILFDQAMLAEGGNLEDPSSFVKRLNGLMMTLSGNPKG